MTATLVRLWAVASLTLKEAVRRKVFILLLLFGAAIVSSAAFFPAIDAPSRLRLIEVWSVRASLLFAVIVSIFLAGFSLPSDFETRRVYTLVTKPIHKMTLFGGKFLGFFLLLAIFLGSMAAISIAYVRLVSALSADDLPPLKAEPRFFPDRLRGAGEFRAMPGTGSLGVSGTTGALVWEFRGLSTSDFGEKIKLKIRADLGRRGQKYAIEGNALLIAVNPQTRARLQHRIDSMHTNQERTVEIDASILSADGALDLALVPAEDDLIAIADTSGAVLYGASCNFELNYFRGMMLVLFQSTVVMAVTLAGSTFLTAPVSIVLGISLYLVGLLWGTIEEGVRDLDVQMDQFRQLMSEGRIEQARTPEDLPPWIIDFSTAVSRVVLKLVPDFSQFDFSDYLLSDHAIMARDLAGGLLAMLPRVAVLIAIGLVAMLFRDFSA